MRPFFKHFGSKWGLSAKLPPPRHDRIVEPFAGAAGYSTRFGEGMRVDLIDSDEQTCSIWDYLLGASQADILALPLLGDTDDVRELGLAPGPMRLIQRWITPQGSRSNWRMTPGVVRIKAFAPTSYWGVGIRSRIAAQLPGISRWTITHGDYRMADVSTPATWQVDPPYQRNKHGRSKYGSGADALDFAALGAWCRGLPGDVLVHEGPGADWLPFRRWAGGTTGRVSKGAMKRCDEYMWTQPEALLARQETLWLGLASA